MKCSIVIINYNDKIRIRRAINSALNQTWKDKEILMVDDGSDEETREIYKEFKDIILIQLEREDKTARTPSRARNAGIRKATGDYICFLDSDNYFSVDFVESLIKYNSDVAFCNWEILGIEQHRIDIEKVWDFQNEVLRNYLQFTHLDHQCLLIKKSYLDKVGLYDERLPRSQDCDMIVRLILNGGIWQHCIKRLFFFEKHEGENHENGNQMKVIASIYGKTLWTLKNNVNMQWLTSKMQTPHLMLSVIKGINTFRSSKNWKEDFEKSDFKALLEDHEDILKEQLSEVLCQERANQPILHA